MLPLKSMVAATPPKIKRRARDQCYGQTYAPPRRKAALRSLTKSGGYIVEDESGRYREFKYRTKCTDGWRRVVLRFYGSMNPNTRCWVWCSCPYFKYHCEVALAKRGSSAVIESNGQRPRFTNPNLEPRVCKHVYLVIAIAMRRRKPGKDDEMGHTNQPKGRRQRKTSARDVWHGDNLRGPQSRRQGAHPED